MVTSEEFWSTDICLHVCIMEGWTLPPMFKWNPEHCACISSDVLFHFEIRWSFFKAHCQVIDCMSVLLAVCVIDHDVDMDLLAHVHGQNECEPTGAEIWPRLNPANIKSSLNFNMHLSDLYSSNLQYSSQKCCDSSFKTKMKHLCVEHKPSEPYRWKSDQDHQHRSCCIQKRSISLNR